MTKIDISKEEAAEMLRWYWVMTYAAVRLEDTHIDSGGDIRSEILKKLTDLTAEKNSQRKKNLKRKD